MLRIREVLNAATVEQKRNTDACEGGITDLFSSSSRLGATELCIPPKKT